MIRDMPPWWVTKGPDVPEWIMFSARYLPKGEYVEVWSEPVSHDYVKLVATVDGISYVFRSNGDWSRA